MTVTANSMISGVLSANPKAKEIIAKHAGQPVDDSQLSMAMGMTIQASGKLHRVESGEDRRAGKGLERELESNPLLWFVNTNRNRTKSVGYRIG